MNYAINTKKIQTTPFNIESESGKVLLKQTITYDSSKSNQYLIPVLASANINNELIGVELNITLNVENAIDITVDSNQNGIPNDIEDSTDGTLIIYEQIDFFKDHFERTMDSIVFSWEALRVGSL